MLSRTYNRISVFNCRAGFTWRFHPRCSKNNHRVGHRQAQSFSCKRQTVTGATAFKKATASGEINQCARQVFLSLYPNRHKSILKPSGCRGWVTLSRHVTLADETILNASSLQDDTIWGCRWGEQTRFAVLDIDEESKYHNELGLARLRHLLASVGFDHPQNYQSSESGGWHLYLSFSDWVASSPTKGA